MRKIIRFRNDVEFDCPCGCKIKVYPHGVCSSVFVGDFNILTITKVKNDRAKYQVGNNLPMFRLDGLLWNNVKFYGYLYQILEAVEKQVNLFLLFNNEDEIEDLFYTGTYVDEDSSTDYDYHYVLYLKALKVARYDYSQVCCRKIEKNITRSIRLFRKIALNNYFSEFQRDRLMKDVSTFKDNLFTDITPEKRAEIRESFMQRYAGKVGRIWR